jgi:hypothetical protein
MRWYGAKLNCNKQLKQSSISLWVMVYSMYLAGARTSTCYRVQCTFVEHHVVVARADGGHAARIRLRYAPTHRRERKESHIKNTIRQTKEISKTPENSLNHQVSFQLRDFPSLR